MLYYKTIDAKTLELLKKLQGISIFKNLRLVGDTALALQIGHRMSIDIDLFGALDADEFEIQEALSQFNTVNLLNKTKNINIYTIEGVKVDIVNFSYSWLHEPFITDDIIMAHTDDIIAMKLSAITVRGSKKDFIDLFFLLQHCNLEKMLDLYSLKFPDGSIFLVLKSLTYFVDADRDLMPVMLKPLNWEHIKKHITSETNKYLKNL